MKYLVAILPIFVCAACGVKSKPLPPLDPVQMGDGKLLYQKDPANKPRPRKAVTIPIEEQISDEK